MWKLPFEDTQYMQYKGGMAKYIAISALHKTWLVTKPLSAALRLSSDLSLFKVYTIFNNLYSVYLSTAVTDKRAVPAHHFYGRWAL